MNDLALAFRLARRELRGGLKGFRIFLACLALGVAAIAAIGSLSRSAEEGLRADARNILGGDVEVRLIHRSAKPDELAWLRRNGIVSATAELRAMAYPQRPDGAKTGLRRDRMLVELKAVDGRYPLYGRLALTGGGSLDAALAARNGVPGAVVEPGVLTLMGARVGDRLRIGAVTFAIRGVIGKEPDRGARIFTLGPRVIVSRAILEKTGLVQPGSLIYHHYRVKLPQGTDAGDWIAAAEAAFPRAGWRIRGLTQAAPGVRRLLERITLFLTLVGLTALLVGGLGIANGVKTYLDGRTATIATFKCLGAPARLVFQTYLLQILMLAMAGIVIGLIVGALLPAGLAGLIGPVLPISLRLGVYPGPLLIAVLFGLLTALAFSLWALARAREVPPALLFRHVVAPAHARPKPVYAVATGALVLALALLAYMTATDKPIALWFIVSALGAFALFRLVAWLIARGAAALSSPAGPQIRQPGLRFALANMHRPGSPAGSVVLSLGLGVTMLVAVALIEGNLKFQVQERMPKKAPTFFFIDILPYQVQAFEAVLRGIDGVGRVDRMPMVRARIVKVGGVPVAKARIAPGVRWAVRSERGLTYAQTPPRGSRIVAGKWWPANYDGPPIVSLDAVIARGMGLKIGDTLTFNILGREVTARIRNLRLINWSSLGMNFTVIFAPGTLEHAPHSHIAAVRADPAAEEPLLTAVTDSLPNVSAIRVRDALDSANDVLSNIGFAIRITASITILAGTLVLAGAVAAGHKRRVYDAVVLKVLGATRGNVLRAFLLEYGLLGIATAAIAAVIGSVMAYLVLTQAMRAPFVFIPSSVALTALLCTAVTVGFGFLGTWWALGQKSAPLLRNE